MQKIVPCLWFDNQAEEAAKFYASIFKNSKVGEVTHYDENVASVAGQPAGSVMTVDLWLEGQKFLLLNGGPMFKFTEAISLMINVENQQELDEINAKLIADGGEQSMCGWVKDKYGLSWQVTPAVMWKMHHDPDPAKRSRMMAAMMDMKKLDIATLERAFEGVGVTR